jgi:hypothetical protein
MSINNQNVTLLADPGAKLTSTKNGLLLEVKGTSQVAIYDLEITGASGMTGIGISLPAGNTAKLDLHRAKITNNQGGGILAVGGTLTITQSVISSNQGLGISSSANPLSMSQSEMGADLLPRSKPDRIRGVGRDATVRIDRRGVACMA